MGFERFAMPIYEYECRGCRSRFEKIVQGPTVPTPSCPSCNSVELDRLLSTFAVGTPLAFIAPKRVACTLRQLRRPAGPGCVLDGLIDGSDLAAAAQ